FFCVSARSSATMNHLRRATERSCLAVSRWLHSRRPIGCLHLCGHGEVAEWLKAPHSKCGIRVTVSGVRIPPSPPASPFAAVRLRPPTIADLLKFPRDLGISERFFVQEGSRPTIDNRRLPPT